MWNATTVMHLNKHACRQCMHFEIIKTWNHQYIARKLAVRHTSFCVWQLVFWLLLVSSNYFTKSRDFSMIIQFFFIPWFFHAWNFFCDFPGFTWFSELVERNWHTCFNHSPRAFTACIHEVCLGKKKKIELLLTPAKWSRTVLECSKIILECSRTMF